METYYFSASQMTVGYEGKPLIKDITLNVKKGEIYHIKKYHRAAFFDRRNRAFGRREH